MHTPKFGVNTSAFPYYYIFTILPGEHMKIIRSSIITSLKSSQYTTTILKSGLVHQRVASDSLPLANSRRISALKKLIFRRIKNRLVSHGIALDRLLPQHSPYYLPANVDHVAWDSPLLCLFESAAGGAFAYLVSSQISSIISTEDTIITLFPRLVSLKIGPYTSPRCSSARSGNSSSTVAEICACAIR